MPTIDTAPDRSAAALALTRELIQRASVTPADADCQALLSQRLMQLGFQVEALPFGAVSNLWARYGNHGPLLVFAGHTDVVPPGPIEDWHSPPFQPDIRDGVLYGRGAADMKASLAAMVLAVKHFLARHPTPNGSIGFLITSDEEGDAVDGTRRVVEHLQAQQIRIDYCIVGEPSSEHRLGDQIRNGRRGSLNGRLRIKGIQGHVAYPELANNPIHAFAPALQALTARIWDEGDTYFPPTSFQISNIHAGTGATNVIPGELEVVLNFRFNPQQTPQGLQQAVQACLQAHGLEADVHWQLSGMPFLTPAGTLTDAVGDAIAAETGYRPLLSTGGGTSDGRFIAPTGAAVVELGPVNASIHKVNEHVAVADISTLSRIYERVLENLLCQPPMQP